MASNTRGITIKRNKLNKSFQISSLTPVSAKMTTVPSNKQMPIMAGVVNNHNKILNRLNKLETKINEIKHAVNHKGGKRTRRHRKHRTRKH